MALSVRRVERSAGRMRCPISRIVGCSVWMTSVGLRYCSKPCVSDQDCYKSETGLVCRQMVLDPAFVASLPPDQQQYLGGIQFSSYCAVPR